MQNSVAIDLNEGDGQWLVETQHDRILLLKFQSTEQLDKSVLESLLTVIIYYFFKINQDNILYGHYVTWALVSFFFNIPQITDAQDEILVLFPSPESGTSIEPIYSTGNAVLIRLNKELFQKYQQQLILKADKV